MKRDARVLGRTPSREHARMKRRAACGQPPPVSERGGADRPTSEFAATVQEGQSRRSPGFRLRQRGPPPYLLPPKAGCTLGAAFALERPHGRLWRRHPAGCLRLLCSRCHLVPRCLLCTARRSCSFAGTSFPCCAVPSDITRLGPDPSGLRPAQGRATRFGARAVNSARPALPPRLSLARQPGFPA